MKSILLLLGLVVLGTFLRVRGEAWGLPWALHIDERLFVAEKVLEVERTWGGGKLPDPGITSYGVLPLWLLGAARAAFAGSFGDGPPTWGDALAITVLLARRISAVWGIVAMLATWAWAARWGRTERWVATALVAGFPALVQAAHFGTVDGALVALLAVGMLSAERLAERPTPGRAVQAGTVLGLALSVKIPALFLLAPFAHALARGRSALARGALLAFVATAVVIGLNPRLLRGGAPPTAPEHTTMTGNLARAFSSSFHDWTLPYAHDIPVWTESTKILPYAIGILPQAAALAGIVLASRRRHPHDLRLLLFLVPQLAVLFAAQVKTVRFLLPVLPALAVLAAFAIACATRWRVLRVAPAVLAATTMLHGAAFSSIYVGLDSRLAALEWIQDHAAPDAIIVFEDPPGYGPPLVTPVRALEKRPLRLRILWDGFYDRHEKRTDEERRAHIERTIGPAEYLVLSEGHRAEYVGAGSLRPVEGRFYADLDAGRLPFRKVASFKSYPHIGPFTLRDDGAEVLLRVFDHPRIDVWRRSAPDSTASPSN